MLGKEVGHRKGDLGNSKFPFNRNEKTTEILGSAATSYLMLIYFKTISKYFLQCPLKEDNLSTFVML